MALRRSNAFDVDVAGQDWIIPSDSDDDDVVHRHPSSVPVSDAVDRNRSSAPVSPAPMSSILFGHNSTGQRGVHTPSVSGSPGHRVRVIKTINPGRLGCLPHEIVKPKSTKFQRDFNEALVQFRSSSQVSPDKSMQVLIVAMNAKGWRVVNRRWVRNADPWYLLGREMDNLPGQRFGASSGSADA